MSLANSSAPGTELKPRHLPMLYWAVKEVHPRGKAASCDKGKEATLVFVRRGRMRVQIENQTLEPCAGELIILPAQILHCIEILKGTSSLMVVFVPSGFAFDESARVIAAGEYGLVERWMTDLAILWKTRDAEREVTGLLLEALLTHIKRLEQRSEAAGAMHPGVQAAEQILERNLAAPLCIAQVAREAHLSIGHLQSLFHRQFGCSPLKYRRELRMKQACRLLEQTNWSLSRIAQACGYSDVEYFGRLFRQTYRVTPFGWRNNGKIERHRPD